MCIMKIHLEKKNQSYLLHRTKLNVLCVILGLCISIIRTSSFCIQSYLHSNRKETAVVIVMMRTQTDGYVVKPTRKVVAFRKHVLIILPILRKLWFIFGSALKVTKTVRFDILREDGWHRQTYSTMVRHEVVLLYWDVLQSMKGPSVEAYVKHIQKLYNLSKPSSHFIIDKESAIFRRSDVIRACVFAFLSRQRRLINRPCPTCKPIWDKTLNQYVSSCEHLTVDAKKLKIDKELKIDLHNGYSPDQIDKNSVNAKSSYKQIKQRYFWLGYPPLVA
mmetsp:Transcript_41890/g.53963  ORF Transcript_41890/g.53963 Transcript_41890/m.53963 type:complete len:276 (+) Transcript_41890:218-1045(+)